MPETGGEPSRAVIMAHGLTDSAADAIVHPDETKLTSDLEWLSQDNHHLLCWDDDAYPALLRRIPNPPAALFVDGDPG